MLHNPHYFVGSLSGPFFAASREVWGITCLDFDDKPSGIGEL